MWREMNTGRHIRGWGGVLALGMSCVLAQANVSFTYQQSWDSGWLAEPTFNFQWDIDQYDGPAGWVEYEIVNRLFVLGTVISADGVERTVSFQATADFTVTFPSTTFTDIDPTALTSILVEDGGPIPFGDFNVEGLDSVVGTASASGVLADGSAFFGNGTTPIFVVAQMSNQSPGPGWHNQLQGGGPSPFGFLDDLKGRLVEDSLLYRLQSDITVVVVPEAVPTLAGGVLVAGMTAWGWARRRRMRQDPK
jgi:hypothetical protein